MKNKNSNQGIWIALAIVVSTLIVCAFIHYERHYDRKDDEKTEERIVYADRISNNVTPSYEDDENNDAKANIQGATQKVSDIDTEESTTSTESNEDELSSTEESNVEAVEEITINETEAVITEEDIINEAIERAESYLKDRMFSEAEKVISEASRQVKNNQRLIEEMDRINSLKPVSLLNLDILSGKPSMFGSVEINTGDTVDGIGVTLTEKIDAGETMYSTISYATLGKYDIFRGKLALKNDSSKNSPIQCYIQVYCDGILSYTSDYVVGGSLPVEIEADIKNAQKVELKYTVHNDNDYYWDPEDWASERFYQISFLLYDAEFLPVYE